MVAQDYLGVEKQYYVPTDRGQEVKMQEYLKRFQRLRAEAGPRPSQEHPKPS